MVSNSTQLWYGKPETLGFVKYYDTDSLWTYESKQGDFASVFLNGKVVSRFEGDGAWNHARKEAEMHLHKLDKGI